jgi:hypothetical protein
MGPQLTGALDSTQVEAGKNEGKFGTLRTYGTGYFISDGLFLSFSEPSLPLQMCVGHSHPGSGTTKTTFTWPGATRATPHLLSIG